MMIFSTEKKESNSYFAMGYGSFYFVRRNLSKYFFFRIFALKQQVKIWSVLVQKRCVAAGDVAVLSQYKAQCTEIKQKLRQLGNSGLQACVNTVVASQGRIDNPLCSLL